jgi:hypothetical protein
MSRSRQIWGSKPGEHIHTTCQFKLNWWPMTMPALPVPCSPVSYSFELCEHRSDSPSRATTTVTSGCVCAELPHHHLILSRHARQQWEWLLTGTSGHKARIPPPVECIGTESVIELAWCAVDANHVGGSVTVYDNRCGRAPLHNTPSIGGLVYNSF